MSDALVLGVVAMVCVTIGTPATVALFLGRRFRGRASKDSIELSTSAGDDKPGK
ncbi:hypothetical protein [Frigoriglobus tundricola]|uniref:Uncharacterized protein n=1 Tax=Frigoriglobus tundricola TaxID=2774151 RepID=A0A6M5YMV9_9BACT|nr:hypothetical protein [Frigoriglobus tundricola]QJW95387.1 hypothetical protein FTUN_2936 [Frigoriglobus tundricola]